MKSQLDNVEGLVKILLTTDGKGLVVKADALNKLLKYFPTDEQRKELLDIIEKRSRE